MNWKQRLVRSLPYILVLLGAAGIAISEEIRYAIFALVGLWLLPSPLSQPNVSRETSNERPEPTWVMPIPKDLTIRRDDDLPRPCHALHGSADPHVLGCEGWTFPR